MLNYQSYNGPEEMDYETGAIEGLLKLQHHATLNPIHPLQQQNGRLPSLSNLLLPQNIEVNGFYSHSTNSWASGSNLLYSPNDDTSSVSSCVTNSRPSLIPPLSTSTSFSSLKSSGSSIKSTHQKASLLSRAATFTARRRGRPKKSNLVITDIKNEIKIVDMTLNYASKNEPNGSPSSNKPRWQEVERLELLEAIVKEKELDDMTTIRWDRISLAVGRAKKACKDQWRREILPNLLKGLRSNNNKTNMGDK